MGSSARTFSRETTSDAPPRENFGDLLEHAVESPADGEAGGRRLQVQVAGTGCLGRREQRVDNLRGIERAEQGLAGGANRRFVLVSADIWPSLVKVCSTVKV